jgi:hypothetical protein
MTIQDVEQETQISLILKRGSKWNARSNDEKKRKAQHYKQQR